MSAAPGFAEALGVWARIGILSFGGPAGQIALMHKMIVEERGWLTERQFLNALNFCMLLPGPEAMQLATFAGWRLHGVTGGLAAGLLFVLPGAAIILAFAWLYALFGNAPAIEAVFVGVKAAVLVIVIEALLRISRRALRHRADWFISGTAFVAIFFFDVPFPMIILAAAAAGFALGTVPGTDSSAVDKHGLPPRVTVLDTLKTAVLWAFIWIVPLLLLTVALGGNHVLTQAGWFFSKLAVVTFGGAYAVLAYMAQHVVQTLGWLQPGEMLDGLGLAETTPGPLILVTEFVGALAAYRSVTGGSFPLLVAGAAVTLWATFAPCFLWIFTGAPYVERIGASARLSGALAGVTAAVVGVILNLALWFALQVFFAHTQPVQYGPARVWVPDLPSADWLAVLLAVVAAALLLWRKAGVVTTLAACSALGFVLRTLL